MDGWTDGWMDGTMNIKLMRKNITIYKQLKLSIWTGQMLNQNFITK